MAMNIIDALVVTLGLDNRQFRKGQGETDADLKKLREGGRRAANDIESSGKKAAEGFRSLRNEVAGVLVVLAGAGSIKSFAENMIAADAATGRLATNLGVSTEDLSSWQIAAQQAGGTANDAAAAFQTLVTIRENMRLGGDLSHGADLAGLGVTDLTDPSKVLMQIAKARDRMAGPEFQNRLQRLGLTEGTINLLTKGSAEVAKLTEEARKNGAVTRQQADDAAAFEAALAKLRTTIEKLARPAVEGLAGALADLANDKDGIDAFTSGIGDALHRIALGFRVAQASLHDFVTIWEDLKSGNFSDALQTFLHGSVEDVKDTLQRGSPALDSRFTKRMGAPSDAALARLTNSGTNDSLFDRLMQQESGGRAGVTGPMTPWGQAHGKTQMLDSTAIGVAMRLSVPWRPDLMRGKSAEAAAYQEKLGRAYLDEGLDRYGGDQAKALMFYHGGPNERLWGARTHAYAASIMGAARSGQYRAGAAAPRSTSNTTNIGPITIHTAATDGRGISRDLQADLRARGLVYQAQSGMVP